MKKTKKNYSRLPVLASELSSMSDEMFVQRTKKDFAGWINHVINDEKLSHTFAQVKDRRLLLQEVNKKMTGQPEQHPFQHTIKEFFVGFALGALAMLMITRAVL